MSEIDDKIEQLLDTNASEHAIYASRVATYGTKDAPKARREWKQMRAEHKAAIKALIAEGVEAFAERLKDQSDIIEGDRIVYAIDIDQAISRYRKGEL